MLRVKTLTYKDRVFDIVWQSDPRRETISPKIHNYFTFILFQFTCFIGIKEADFLADQRRKQVVSNATIHAGLKNSTIKDIFWCKNQTITNFTWLYVKKAPLNPPKIALPRHSRAIIKTFWCNFSYDAPSPKTAPTTSPKKLECYKLWKTGLKSVQTQRTSIIRSKNATHRVEKQKAKGHWVEDPFFQHITKQTEQHG